MGIIKKVKSMTFGEPDACQNTKFSFSLSYSIVFSCLGPLLLEYLAKKETAIIWYFLTVNTDNIAKDPVAFHVSNLNGLTSGSRWALPKNCLKITLISLNYTLWHWKCIFCQIFRFLFMSMKCLPMTLLSVRRRAAWKSVQSVNYIFTSTFKFFGSDWKMFQKLI